MTQKGYQGANLLATSLWHIRVWACFHASCALQGPHAWIDVGAYSSTDSKERLAHVANCINLWFKVTLAELSICVKTLPSNPRKSLLLHLWCGFMAVGDALPLIFLSLRKLTTTDENCEHPHSSLSTTVWTKKHVKKKQTCRQTGSDETLTYHNGEPNWSIDHPVGYGVVISLPASESTINNTMKLNTDQNWENKVSMLDFGPSLNILSQV